MALPGRSWPKEDEEGREEKGAKGEEGKKKENQKKNVVMSVQ